MKETVLDLLMFLFENYMDEQPHLPGRHQHAEFYTKLLAAGFEQEEIDQAFAWLEGVLHNPAAGMVDPNARAFRIYDELEQAQIDRDARGFLLQLEQIGLVTPSVRETVIDRAMALDEDEIDIERLKWVVLLVLFAIPGEEQNFARMEELVFDDAALLH